MCPEKTVTPRPKGCKCFEGKNFYSKSDIAGGSMHVLSIEVF